MTSKPDDKSELQRRYLTIFNSKIVGLLSTSSQGQILDANDCFLEMVGYTREDLHAGRLSWIKLTPPEYLQESLKIQATLKEQPGVSLSFEKEYFHKDGRRIPVRLGVTGFENGSNITLVQDISQQKKVERKLEEANALLEERVEMRTRELAESEAFLSAIFDNMPNMVFVKEAKNLTFVRLNRAGEELVGINRKEVIGKNDYDLHDARMALLYVSADQKVLAEKSVVDIPMEELQTPKGIRLIHTRKIPILDKNGETQYLLGVSEDITERVHAEREREVLLQEKMARQAAETRLKQMSLLSDITFAMSKSFDLRSILRAFSEKVVPVLADVCLVDIIDEEGMDYAMVEIKADRPEDEEFVTQWRRQNPPKWDAQFGGPTTMRSGKTEVVNHVDQILDHVKDHYAQDPMENRDPSKEPFVKAFITVPLMVRDGKPLGNVGFLSTHSRRTFSPEDQALAEEVSRRLASLVENSRLYYRSQDASRAKSSFLANVSHEIRTPLGAMLGFAEILREDTSLNLDQQQSVDTVLRNGHQLLKIVNEILDISKVESEKIEVEQIEFSLKALLQDVIHLLRQQAEEKGLELILELGEVPDNMISDPNRIRQVLINIVGNAVKFTENGHVLLKVNCKTDQSARRVAVEFHVIDTGIGISPQQRANMFQAFSQADASTTRRFGGTGLGLFLSRKLARLLGGDILLKSSVAGKGSHFVINIKAQLDGDKVGVASAGAEQAFHHHAGASPMSGSILIVDDASDNRELFKRYLLRAGVAEDHIEMAENGKEALRKATQQSFRLILMDIQMPEMDGFQTLHELRARGYEAPVVALTAHAMKGDREKCLEAGFDGYLQKPLKREALNEILKTDFL